MTNSKPKMSASYKAVFILSIFMAFFVLLAGAATKSKGSGFGMWVWGYTAWLMYKRRISQLVSFYKFMLWFDIIASGVAVAVFVFGDSEVGGLVNYSAVEVFLLFAIVISITFSLYKYFSKVQFHAVSNPNVDDSDSTIWEQVSMEITQGKRVDRLWTRAFSESDGDSNRANARYIKLRFNQIKSETDGESPLSSHKPWCTQKDNADNNVNNLWHSFPPQG